MINAIIVGHEAQTFHAIERSIGAIHPQVTLCGQAKSCQETLAMIEQSAPDLLFLETEMPKANCFQMLDRLSGFSFETILLAHSDKLAFDAVKYQVSGFVLKPIETTELADAIHIAEYRIKTKKKIQENELLLHDLRDQPPLNDLFPIPTMDGYDFIPVQDIIRCEGFQRCTRIVTKNKSDILSSHHIGVFVKQLEKHRFFSTHKSHLINPSHIKKYYKEGTLQMADDSMVPVSKRRKSNFIKLMIAR